MACKSRSVNAARASASSFSLRWASSASAVAFAFCAQTSSWLIQFAWFARHWHGHSHTNQAVTSIHLLAPRLPEVFIQTHQDLLVLPLMILCTVVDSFHRHSVYRCTVSIESWLWKLFHRRVKRVQRAHAYISVRATTTDKTAKKQRKLDEIASIVNDEYLFQCNQRQK